MSLDEVDGKPMMAVQAEQSGDSVMVNKDRWEQIQRLFRVERRSISAIARELGIDRKTVRRSLRSATWQPYQRPPREDTLLSEHESFLRERAPQVGYSARILYQELVQGRSFTGSYDVVKRFVAPLRALEAAAQATQRRFETPPGQQSQIDWGQARVQFRCGTRTMHIFVLTLGFSGSRGGDSTGARPTNRSVHSWRRMSGHSSTLEGILASICMIGRGLCVDPVTAARDSAGTAPSAPSPITGDSNPASASPTGLVPRARSSRE